MLAGSICEETDCTDLLLILLALAVAALIVAVLVAVLWAVAISAQLARRGWSPARRRSAAVLIVVVAARLLLAAGEAMPDLRGVLALVVLVPPLPLLIWQHRTRRVAQSSPCSTA